MFKIRDFFFTKRLFFSVKKKFWKVKKKSGDFGDFQYFGHLIYHHQARVFVRILGRDRDWKYVFEFINSRLQCLKCAKISRGLRPRTPNTQIRWAFGGIQGTFRHFTQSTGKLHEYNDNRGPSKPLFYSNI